MLKSKYLRKIIIYSMILVIIPVLSLGILSYSKTKGIIETKVNQGNMQVLIQTELKVEQVLQTIDNAIVQFINTPTVSESIRTNFEPKDFAKVKLLSGGLYKLQTYDLGISDVRMASFAHNWYLDNSGFSHSLSFEEMKPLKSMMQYPELSKWDTNIESSKILLIKKLPINTFKYSDGIIVTVVPNYKLQRLLPEFSGDSDTIVFDADYRMLTNVSNPDFTQDKIDQVVRHLQSSGENSGSSLIRLNNGSLGITYKKSSFNDWYYVTLVSIEQIMKESRAIGWYTFYICSAVFVILLGLAWVGSNKIYLPVRKIFESSLGNNKEDVDDELQFIGKHIHTLRTSESRLLGQVQGQTKQLEEFFIRKLLLGELSTKEIQDKTTQFHYDLGSDSYCVLTVQIDTLVGTKYKEIDHDILMFAVNNIVSELTSLGSRLEPVVIGRNQVMILRNKSEKPDMGKNDVYILSELIQKTVKDILSLQISVGISRFYTDLTLCEQAFRECLEALKYRIRFGEEAILHIEDVLPNQKIQTIYPVWIENQLIDALKIPDLEKAEQLLHEFLSVTLRDNIRHQEYQMILFRLLSDLIREIQHTGENLQDSSQEDQQLFEQLFNLRTIAETEKWFMNTIMKPMVVLLNKKWDSQNRNISDHMMKMIHEEYETDLTLDLCATRLNYHPNYLKTVFRKETGVNFSDYLSQCRLNQAKKWLLETDMKISEIAEKLRYQNSQNFIRYFRKIEDMTPGDYRKKYRNT